MEGHEAVAEALLDKNVAVEPTNAEGMTPLHLAARDEATKMLLDMGANKEATSQFVFFFNVDSYLHWLVPMFFYFVVRVILFSLREKLRCIWQPKMRILRPSGCCLTKPPTRKPPTNLYSFSNP